MITRKILYRGEAAKNTHYYNDQKDDYYSKEGDSAVWQGEGAKKLGLTGEVKKEEFQAMLLGNFGQGIKLSPSVRKDSKARSGLDLTISAPKSVTIQALVGGDSRVIEAHDKAVTETLRFIEENLAQSRQKINKKSHVQNTKNLIIAKFRHETARSVDGELPDPQLHTHCVIMNLTQRKDGSWASLHNDQIVKLRQLQDSVYMSVLAKELINLGYEIRHEKTHIELAHISRQQIEQFSKRSAQIAADLESRHNLEKEVASHAARQAATLATRSKKDISINRAELYMEWVKQANEIGLNLEGEKLKAKTMSLKTQQKTVPVTERVAEAALIWAIKHITERETVIERSNLISTALMYTEGTLTVKDISKAITVMLDQKKIFSRPDHYISNTEKNGQAKTKESWAKEYAEKKNVSISEALKAVNSAIKEGRLSKIEPLYATQEALELERNILKMEAHGRGAVLPVLSKESLALELENSTLKKGQRDAVELMLSGENQIVGIQGLAGTGKSYALQTTQDLLRKQGYKMIALAPYGTQVANLRKDGIKAKTIASQLTATDTERLQRQLGEKTVVVIDEAGVIPVRQMEKLLKQLQPSGARIVLLGDTAQTKAVEAGRAFAMLQEKGMKTAKMSDIQRQQNDRLKKAVELAAEGSTAESLKLIDKVAEIPDKVVTLETGEQVRDGFDRYLAIAKEYTSLPLSEQSKTLIVTGTNHSRKAINELVRQEKGLNGKGSFFELLARHDTTRMERRHARYYNTGDIIQPERDYKNGLKRGELYEIVQCNIKRDRLLVKSLSDNSEIEIIPKIMSKLSVYHKHKSEVSVGDVVRVTRNNAELDLANGERYEVINVTKKSITIAGNDKTVTLDASKPIHLDHAYATTAHSAQGLTCDRVFYNAESISRTTAQDTYYVSISRERHEVVVFTDNANKLPNAVQRESYKGLAHDLVSLQSHLEKHDYAKKSKENFHELGL